MNFTYKNKTNQELVIPNVGTVSANGTISSEFKLENPNLEEINNGGNLIGSQNDISTGSGSASVEAKEEDN
jgi:hypothetical protein